MPTKNNTSKNIGKANNFPSALFEPHTIQIPIQSPGFQIHFDLKEGCKKYFHTKSLQTTEQTEDKSELMELQFNESYAEKTGTAFFCCSSLSLFADFFFVPHGILVFVQYNSRFRLICKM
ncbi:hypothetical protein CDAR_49351 [Caerostris darwini]|uniref:Uncharacterized protein n=1 Tax=Caerostris darwini TaxID=1538125 RepID=A0AAV4Q937_9ARAC|nr:hypothetical protein CDAR_49351 [Caerostris darwini]